MFAFDCVPPDYTYSITAEDCPVSVVLNIAADDRDPLDSITGADYFDIASVFMNQSASPRGARWAPIETDKAQFLRLRDQWHRERGSTSSLSAMVECAAYLRIIGMGDKALPFILDLLGQEMDDPDHWFVALESITEHDPISEDMYGDTVAMATAWLNWAQEQNVR